jgi:exopolysaccharide biosynthesis polyprenyl glycosylphosphotransferase
MLLRRLIISILLAAVLTEAGRKVIRETLLRTDALPMTRSVMLLGHTRAVAGFLAHGRIGHAPWLQVIGACLVGPTAPDEVEGLGVGVFGDLTSLVDAVVATNCDMVVAFPSAELDASTLRELSRRLSDFDVDFAVIPLVAEVATTRISVSSIDGLPLLHVRPPVLAGRSRLAKDIADRLAAALLLVLLAPLMLALAAAIRSTSRGPALFRQVRVGRGGREFTRYKFRTMVEYADSRRGRLQRPTEDNTSRLFTVRHDPQITRLGGVLRRWSLDDLPQLLNVVKGDMALVGPRPALPAEAAKFDENTRYRLSVKPGITGLWQVNANAPHSSDESIRLDLSYLENWSPKLDAMILLRTTAAVVRGTGTS